WLVLNAPALDGQAFDGAEDEVLDHQTDDDHRQKPGENLGDIEHVLVLEDEPAETARTGADTEDQLGRDQGTPGEGPADFQPGQDRGEGGGDQDFENEGR